MGKLAERRIELAKRVLETEDKETLAAVEIALLGPAPLTFSKKEIEEMEAQVDRLEKGLERGYTWAEVKKRALRKKR